MLAVRGWNGRPSDRGTHAVVPLSELDGYRDWVAAVLVERQRPKGVGSRANSCTRKGMATTPTVSRSGVSEPCQRASAAVSQTWSQCSLAQLESQSDIRALRSAAAFAKCSAIQKAQAEEHRLRAAQEALEERRVDAAMNSQRFMDSANNDIAAKERSRANREAAMAVKAQMESRASQRMRNEEPLEQERLARKSRMRILSILKETRKVIAQRKKA